MPPPVFYGTDFEPYFSANITAAFRELLSTKHLYQSVTIDDAFIAGVASAKHAMALRRMASMIGGGSSGSPTQAQYEAEGKKLFQKTWVPKDAAPEFEPGVPRSLAGVGAVLDAVEFSLPTINTVCTTPSCSGRPPFNPQPAARKHEVARDWDSHQWFFLSYECQNCKREPIRFLVRRSGLKLTLSGRDPIETVDVPKVIPKSVAKFFSGAVVAHQCGETLSGLFMLRVCIEQYWKSVPAVAAAVKGKAKPTGDELGAAYKSTLPEDFKVRFPTLAETYDAVSGSLHAADANPVAFEAARANIVKHFEAKRLFELTDTGEATA